MENIHIIPIGAIIGFCTGGLHCGLHFYINNHKKTISQNPQQKQPKAVNNIDSKNQVNTTSKCIGCGGKGEIKRTFLDIDTNCTGFNPNYLNQPYQITEKFSNSYISFYICVGCIKKSLLNKCLAYILLLSLCVFLFSVWLFVSIAGIVSYGNIEPSLIILMIALLIPMSLLVYGIVRATVKKTQNGAYNVARVAGKYIKRVKHGWGAGGYAEVSSFTMGDVGLFNKQFETNLGCKTYPYVNAFYEKEIKPQESGELKNILDILLGKPSNILPKKIISEITKINNIEHDTKNDTKTQDDLIKKLKNLFGDVGFEKLSEQGVFDGNYKEKFGTVPDIPICVTSLPNSYAYIKSLRCVSDDETIVNSVRLGSTSHKEIILDMWEITIKNTKSNIIRKVILYIAPYSTHNSYWPNGFAPSGLITDYYEKNIQKTNYYGAKDMTPLVYAPLVPTAKLCTQCGASFKDDFCDYCNTTYLRWEKPSSFSKNNKSKFITVGYNGDEKHRYYLQTEGKKHLVCVGFCPSTANENEPDQTTLRVMKYAELQGYDGIVMINLYPLRYQHFGGAVPQVKDDSLIQKNIEVIRQVLSSLDGEITMWAAWGEIIDRWRHSKECLAKIVETTYDFDCKWVFAGELTKTGHPRVPTFMGYDWVLNGFDIDDYL
ncbi:MAG: DUF1643 domain-containing protein [Firmicutes bacterium]|nr:DUF1643 domain-containing protein [Bacillota bacterium]